jgi:hypothetical protein
LVSACKHLDRVCLTRVVVGWVATQPTQLRGATLDEYERRSSKSVRYKPQEKDKPSCGVPKVSRVDDQVNPAAAVLLALRPIGLNRLFGDNHLPVVPSELRDSKRAISSFN